MTMMIHGSHRQQCQIYRTDISPMIFLEPVIAALLGAGVTALAVFFKKNIAAQMVLKYGSLVKKAYDIIDVDEYVMTCSKDTDNYP